MNKTYEFSFHNKVKSPIGMGMERNLLTVYRHGCRLGGIVYNRCPFRKIIYFFMFPVIEYTIIVSGKIHIIGTEKIHNLFIIK